MLKFLVPVIAATLLAVSHISRAGDYTLIEARPGEAVIQTTEVLGMLDAFPKIHVFNVEGKMLGTIAGYGHDGLENEFYVELDKLLAKKTASSTSLFNVLPHWIMDGAGQDDGEGIPVKLPAADFYIVERYAEWCTPCLRLIDEFPQWAAQQDSSIVMIKLDLMPRNEPERAQE